MVDCANGATYHIAPNVFAELGAEVIAIGDKPDGFNINQSCGSTAPELLCEHVLKVGADIGIALDGDGDRVIMVDANGQIINGDQILYIIALDRQARGVLHGGVVGTLMSNYGLEKALSNLNIPFLRAKVGDRYVLELLHQHNWKIGGEASGHIVCLDKTSTGDGIIAALQVLAIMVKQHKQLHELTTGMTLLPQVLINFKTERAAILSQHNLVVDVVRSVEQQLQNRGRVLLRPSGTEPLLRVMVEGEHLQQMRTHAETLVNNIASIEQSLL